MCIRPRLAAGLLLALGATATNAQPPGQYFGIYGFEKLASEYEYVPRDDAEMDGDLWRLKLGYEFNRFLAVEAHYGFDGFDGDPPRLREGAIFGRFQLPYERLNVYFLGGMGRVGATVADADGEVRETDSGPATGVGIELFGTERTALGLEYVRYQVGDDDRKYDALTLGLKHHFDWPTFRE